MPEIREVKWQLQENNKKLEAQKEELKQKFDELESKVGSQQEEVMKEFEKVKKRLNKTSEDLEFVSKELQKLVTVHDTIKNTTAYIEQGFRETRRRLENSSKFIINTVTNKIRELSFANHYKEYREVW